VIAVALALTLAPAGARAQVVEGPDAPVAGRPEARGVDRTAAQVVERPDTQAAARADAHAPGQAAPGQDHREHTGAPAQPPAPAEPHDHGAHERQPRALPPYIPPVTDADRAAAIPDVTGHAVHDRSVNYFVLFDQLEWKGSDGGDGGNWDTKGWIGGDRNRFWFRTEGAGGNGRLDYSQTHAMFGRAISRWWDLVAGVRHNVRPGPAQTWLAVGLQGLAPYWFEVEATAYLGASGTHVRVETEYDLKFTNRLVLQPLVEVEIYGRSDPEHSMGAGLSTVDAGLRLRYELRREFAPYLGVTWQGKYFRTADLARAAGDSVGEARLVVGLRTWF
jgi:copper resistance protein B